MVYCGKPSGGCHACRSRKTKCDKTPLPTGCTQCKRAKRECPGYRVIGDLVFRNESSNVIRKAKAKEERLRVKESGVGGSSSSLVAKGESPGSGNEWNSNPFDGDWEDEEGLEIVGREQSEESLAIFTLAPTLEDRATGFFIKNYVLGMDGPSKGHYDYLVDVSRSQILDDGLVHAMKAVGLAGFAHTVHAPGLLGSARYQYMKAIKETNRALRDPVAVKNDSTLLAIMILGIFEAVTGVEKRSIKDWEEHLLGAAAVIKLRGPQQVYTPAGRRMLFQATSALMISCIRRGVPLPPHIVEFMTLALSLVPSPPDPALLVQSSMLHFCILRHLVRSKKLTHPPAVLSQALELDNKLNDIVNPIPPGWEYQTQIYDKEAKRGRGEEFVWQGEYHVYYDYWIAQIWNAWRTMRIMLNEMMRENLLAGFSSNPPLFTDPEYFLQLQTSTKVLYQMQSDILRSIPQHIGCFNESLGGEIVDTAGGGGGKGKEREIMDIGEGFPTIRQSGGSFLIWPLWLVGLMDLSNEEVKEFVGRNLRGVAERMGIRQAGVLADLLDEGEKWRDAKRRGETGK